MKKQVKEDAMKRGSIGEKEWNEAGSILSYELKLF